MPPPTETQPVSQFRALKRLMREFKPYKGQVAAVLGLGFVISAAQPASVKVSQRIIDELKVGVGDDFFRWVPLALVLIFAVSGFAKYFHNTLRRIVCERVLIQFRSRIFNKYLVLPQIQLDRSRTGELLSSIQNDLQQISSGIDTLCDIFREPVTFFGLIGFAFYCDWRLTLFTLVAAPLVIVLFSRSGAAVKRYSSRNLALFSDLMSLSQESLTGSRVVKVFRLEKELRRKFDAIQNSYFHTLSKSIRVQELATPSVEFIGAILMGLVIVYGGYRIQSGALTAGELVAFVIALGLAQMPIKQLNNAYLKLKGAEAASERVYALLDLPEVQLNSTVAIRVNTFRKSIVYEDVSVAYSDKLALKGVSFEIRAGERLALVGQSGSGKTTVANSLARLYELSAGRILLDGHDIRGIELDDLRAMISFVTQDTFLFHDTIYENIRYGRSDATPAEIYRAAEMAHCEDFIAKCPQGFDTVIGDRGMCLSGGERQRLAIARAMLKSAPILVLDEATSSLDSHSEQIVQSALDELMEGKTTLMVAHRFSTIARANRILVMEAGRVREIGTHRELIDQNGIYHGLFRKQTAFGTLET